jgi:predicted SPOUT superfamily RNA methylase MTH1
MFLYPRRKNLSVILFTSIFDTENSLSEITLKLSYIIRFLVDFRVSELWWVRDSKRKGIEKIIRDLVEYALAPPYAKRYIPIRPTLKKVGLLEPVNIPAHVVINGGAEGEIRISVNGDIGLNKKKEKLCNKKYCLIIDSESGEIVSYPFYPYYTGFKLHFIDKKQFLMILNDKIESSNILIGSRIGVNIQTISEKIKEIYESKGLRVVIGPPKEGLAKYLNSFNGFLINFLPKQGVKDVRAEEALMASLTLLNYFLE